MVARKCVIVARFRQPFSVPKGPKAVSSKRNIIVVIPTLQMDRVRLG